MIECIKNVDETNLPVEMVEKVAKVITDAGFVVADHLADTPTAQIEALAGATNGPASGLLKRAFALANDITQAKRMRASMKAAADAVPGPKLGAPPVVHGAWGARMFSCWIART